MPVMLERWNDDRMDALDAKVGVLDRKVGVLDAKVNAVDAKVDDLDRRMEKGFARVDADLREQRQEMKAGFERMHRLLVQFCGLMLAALVGLIATQL